MEKDGKKPTPKKFICECCNFSCENKKDYNRHLKTKKHKSYSSGDIDKNAMKDVKACKYCNKEYKSNSGLWKHEQKCSQTQEISDINSTDYKQLVMDMINQNSDLQKMLLEQQEQYNKSLQDMVPKIQNVTNNNTTHNTNKVNINIFLNEQCKDAINMSEFVHSLEIGFAELEKTYRMGNANGLSQIFIDGLKDLDMYKRPLHCSNLQKRTLYVKDNDEWQRDDHKLREAIEILNTKNGYNVPSYVIDATEAERIKQDEIPDVICETMVDDETMRKNMEKIIRNVAKEVMI